MRINTKMATGVAGQTIEQALAKLEDMTLDITPISIAEFQQRLHQVRLMMKEANVAILFITPGSNLLYFTGINWMCTERLCGVIIPEQGDLIYIVPHFELDSFNEHITLHGKTATWQEHENPIELVIKEISRVGLGNTNLTNIELANKSNQPKVNNKINVALCGSTSFTTVSKFITNYGRINFVCADELTIRCRQVKSVAEIALIQKAMDMTLVVQRAAASILYEGISSKEVVDFINKAHRKVGASGSYFCIVLFAKASALPHGIKGWQTLKANDMVLIDTGCKLMGYTSDITRSYVYGEPTNYQREVWNAEKAAQVSNSCEYVDQQARENLAENGFSSKYDLPGLPHRTGHGIGIDIHEAPYLVGGDKTLLVPGMCFSNEPTICIPEKFGIRLEDHFYMTEAGPKWFTEPSYSIDDPFGLGK